jgi:hypothetical protein
MWRNASPKKATVVGRHRATNRFITVIVDVCFLYCLRLSLVRSPHIISQHWEHPEQLRQYGRDQAAAQVALESLLTRSAGEGKRA